MPVLTNERHELFCKGVAGRRSPDTGVYHRWIQLRAKSGRYLAAYKLCRQPHIAERTRSQLEKELEHYFAELEVEQAIEKAKAIAAWQANGSDDG